eukprot:COSAG03_NODE_578_length_6879_cov_5.096018_3_plen_92_part_00
MLRVLGNLSLSLSLSLSLPLSLSLSLSLCVCVCVCVRACADGMKRQLLQAPVGVAGPAMGLPDAVAVEPEPAPAVSAEEDELAALEAQMAQ